MRQPRAMMTLECFGCAKNAIRRARKEGTLHSVLARSPRLRAPYFPVSLCLQSPTVQAIDIDFKLKHF